MFIKKVRVSALIIVVSFLFLTGLAVRGSAESFGSQGTVTDENLRPGMKLQDAIELLGPPERIMISDSGTLVIPYVKLGLSLEARSNGTLVEEIHFDSSFKGEAQRDSKVFENPEKSKVVQDNTDDKQEFFPRSHEKKVVHAYKPEPEKRRKENGTARDVNVFDLYGFRVKNTLDGVIITEILPGSVAEKGGLKEGERVRKAFITRSGVRNIYTSGGLKAILERALERGEDNVRILQKNNNYYIVEVPE